MPDIVLVPIGSDLDVSTVPRVRATVDSLIRGGCRRIILNMADVRYVDSVGMALIFSETRKMREEDGLVSLTNVRPEVYRALRIARLVDFIPVSLAGPRPPIPVLDPIVRPLWRRTMRVEPTRMFAVRERVGELLSSLPLSPDEVFDMELAGGEAVGNAVDHACPEGVLVTVTSYPDRVVMEVSDCGCGYELAEDEEPVPSDATGERGRGIKLMRLLADSVTIARKPSGTGTVVRLVKLVGSRPALGTDVAATL